MLLSTKKFGSFELLLNFRLIRYSLDIQFLVVCDRSAALVTGYRAFNSISLANKGDNAMGFPSHYRTGRFMPYFTNETVAVLSLYVYPDHKQRAINVCPTFLAINELVIPGGIQ